MPEGIEERQEREERDREELTRLLLRAAFLLGSDPEYLGAGWRPMALRNVRLALIEWVSRMSQGG